MTRRQAKPIFRPEIWSDDVLDQAVAWQVELHADSYRDDVEAGWQEWYQSCASHRQAWAQLQMLNSDVKRAPEAGRQILQRADQQSRQRRRVLKGLLGLTVVVPAMWWLPRTAVWRSVKADYATVAGQRRELTLPDGSMLWLNTASQINLHYSETEREIELLHGEIYLKTAKNSRPLFVRTPRGVVRALGTEFMVRDLGGATDVALYQGRIEVENAAFAQSQHLLPGQGVEFNRNHIGPVVNFDKNRSGWRRGMLIVQNWSLQQFCAELERYLPGKLYCAERAAELRISGSFPLDDPQALLQKLPKILPVQVQSFSQYWFAVTAA